MPEHESVALAFNAPFSLYDPETSPELVISRLNLARNHLRKLGDLLTSSIQPTQATSAPGPVTRNGRRRGPKPDLENHLRVKAIVEKYGEKWKEPEALEAIAEQLDSSHIPVPRAWRDRKLQSRTWARAAENYHLLVIKAIDYRLRQSAK